MHPPARQLGESGLDGFRPGAIGERRPPNRLTRQPGYPRISPLAGSPRDGTATRDRGLCRVPSRAHLANDQGRDEPQILESMGQRIRGRAHGLRDRLVGHPAADRDGARFITVGVAWAGMVDHQSGRRSRTTASRVNGYRKTRLG
jgi:hypothetical protein